MKYQAIDLTAGRRARSIRLHPELTHPTLDPTDPRCEASRSPHVVRRATISWHDIVSRDARRDNRAAR
jgi:hypothetical protein